MILYSGKYRSAALYARWLSQATGLQAAKADAAPSLPVDEPTIVICSLYAGSLHGSKTIRKCLEQSGIRRFILITCGLSDPHTNAHVLDKAAARAFENLEFVRFGVRGGIDYGKLSRIDRILMGAMKRHVLTQVRHNGRADREQTGFLESYGKAIFLESEDQLDPVLHCLQTLSDAGLEDNQN